VIHVHTVEGQGQERVVESVRAARQGRERTRHLGADVADEGARRIRGKGNRIRDRKAGCSRRDRYGVHVFVSVARNHLSFRDKTKATATYVNGCWIEGLSIRWRCRDGEQPEDHQQQN